jgi:hypothetical protein
MTMTPNHLGARNQPPICLEETASGQLDLTELEVDIDQEALTPIDIAP